MFAALLSIMEPSGLTTDASRPAIVSSIFLSSNGKPLAIIIVVLAAAIVVAGAGLDGLGGLVSQSQPQVRLSTIVVCYLSIIILE